MKISILKWPFSKGGDFIKQSLPAVNLNHDSVQSLLYTERVYVFNEYTECVHVLYTERVHVFNEERTLTEAALVSKSGTRSVRPRK